MWINCKALSKTLNMKKSSFYHGNMLGITSKVWKWLLDIHVIYKSSFVMYKKTNISNYANVGQGLWKRQGFKGSLKEAGSSAKVINHQDCA